MSNEAFSYILMVIIAALLIYIYFLKDKIFQLKVERKSLQDDINNLVEGPDVVKLDPGQLREYLKSDKTEPTTYIAKMYPGELQHFIEASKDPDKLKPEEPHNAT